MVIAGGGGRPQGARRSQRAKKGRRAWGEKQALGTSEALDRRGRRVALMAPLPVKEPRGQFTADPHRCPGALCSPPREDGGARAKGATSENEDGC